MILSAANVELRPQVVQPTILYQVAVVGGTTADCGLVVAALEHVAVVTATPCLTHLSKMAREVHLVVIGDPESLDSTLALIASRRAPMTPILAVIPRSGPSWPPRLLESVDDFVIAPVRPEELRTRAQRLLGFFASAQETHSRLTESAALRQLIGSAPALREVTNAIPTLARVGAAVLITGETGTGKELCARALHHCSPRRGNAFIAVDCSAIPDHLFENELFGHARGAFTDAHADRKGLAALAHGGTMFLDEIDALSMIAQAKLLRFLEDGSFRPLGAEQFSRSETAIIAATNADLELRVAERTFRSDLYYRLNLMRLRLPPLRERLSDVAALAEHFLHTFAVKNDAPPKRLTPAALRCLLMHDWPGNVRELRNVVHRAAVLTEGIHILPVRLSLPGHTGETEPSVGRSFKMLKAKAVETFERAFIEDLLRRHGGNVTRAAREAQQDRRVLRRLIKKHHITRKAG